MSAVPAPRPVEHESVVRLARSGTFRGWYFPGACLLDVWKPGSFRAFRDDGSLWSLSCRSCA
eukprot:4799419-Prymnesium_polylepis.1